MPIALGLLHKLKQDEHKVLVRWWIPVVGVILVVILTVEVFVDIEADKATNRLARRMCYRYLTC